MPDANSVVPSGAPSRAPIASSQADQVALSTRPYSGWPAGTFPAPTKVDDSSTGGPTGAPGVRAGRPAATARVSADQRSSGASPRCMARA